MNSSDWLASFLSIVTLLAVVSSAQAAQPGLVLGDNVNVRGQSTIYSEVVTQLQEGEKVIVFETLQHEQPEEGNPAQWYRIAMPANTPVWVHADYISPAQTVTANLLNIRSGPGTEYSVMGQLNQGARVNQIRTVGDWMEIEPPKGVYAFVAASLVKLTGEEIPDQPVATETASTQESAKATEEDASKETAQTSESTDGQTETQPDQTASTTKPKASPEKDTATASEELRTAEPLSATNELTALKEGSESGSSETNATEEAGSTAQFALPPAVTRSTGELASTRAGFEPIPSASRDSSSSAPRRRVVSREGMVEKTVSIQAPTYYRLVVPGTDKTIEFIFTEEKRLNLGDYIARRVIVTGPEYLDERWPKIPVLKVDTLELLIR